MVWKCKKHGDNCKSFCGVVAKEWNDAGYTPETLPDDERITGILNLVDWVMGDVDKLLEEWKKRHSDCDSFIEARTYKNEKWFKKSIHLAVGIGRDEITNKIKDCIEDTLNPKTSCKCGWKGREKDLKMDEAIEFHCPKCEKEIEIEGCDPEVVKVLTKLKSKLVRR